MTKSTKSTRASLYVKYKNKNMSTSITPYLQSFTFSKTIAGSGDSFSFSLADPNDKWVGSWKPKTGAEIYASAKYWGFNGSQTIRKLIFGHFELNSISVKAPPTTASIECSSIPKGKGAKTKRTQTYKNCTMRSVTNLIAKRLGVKLIYKANSTPSYDILEQTKENDLVFLKRICSENGFSIKISTKYLTILDDADLEAKPSKYVIKKSNTRIKSYDFTETLNGGYKSCKVYYTKETKTKVKEKDKDGKTVTKTKTSKKTISCSFTPKKPPATSGVLKVEEEFKNLAVGKRIAQNRLREANKELNKATFSFIGLLNVNEGDTVDLKGFGGFDGKYIITTYGGNVSTSGTDCTLELRKCLVGY